MLTVQFITVRNFIMKQQQTFYVVLQVIRFIIWWWCMIRYKNTPLGQLISFLKQIPIFEHSNLQALLQLYMHRHPFTDSHLMAFLPGLPGWAGTRKVKPIWILLKQETVSGSGMSRATCKSAPRSRQITTPAPHHSSFLQAGCPSCLPTNSIKALKAKLYMHN